MPRTDISTTPPGGCLCCMNVLFETNHLLNTTHKKALRVRLNDFNLSFTELLNIAKSSPIHTKNLKLMVCEVYKILNHLNPQTMWES